MKKNRNSKRFIRNLSLLFILICMNTGGLFAQVKISGTITDSNKEPLIGVNIKVADSKAGTISDANGFYSIQVPNKNSVLVFTYIGYKAVQKPVGIATVINLAMEEDTKLMDEVVVVAYGTQKKSHLTGAVSSLKNEKLDEIPVSSIAGALQGKLAGVQIQNVDPEAGESPVIRVRGMGSISAALSPLVVVDGFPIPDGMAGVSMSDVESIEVLKDAASASMYGSRAAGGVILITTKSGNITKPKYQFKMFTGVRKALKLPEMMSTNQYTQLLYNEAALRQQDPSVDGTNMKFNMITTGEQAAYLIGKYYSDQPTDWLQEGLRQNGSNQNYQLSASGGDKNIKYFISGSYTGENGIMKKNNFDKYNLRAKLDVNLSKNVTIGINIAPSYSRQEKPVNDLTDYTRYPSWMPVRHNEATAALTGKINGDYAQASDFNGINMSGIGLNGETWDVTAVNPFSSSNQTPTSIRERTSVITDDYRMQNNFYITIKILPGLEFKTSNGAFVEYKEYNKKEQTSANKAGVPNQLTREMSMKTELLTENTLNYNKKFGYHEIGAVAGITYQKSNLKFNRMVGTGFADEQILSFNYASALIMDSPSITGTTSSYIPDALLSYISRLTYAYKGKYLLSGSVRLDGSQKFSTGIRQWGTFPAGSIGWRASEEYFLKQFDWLSNLKVRASYGLTGNNNIPTYSNMNQLYTSNYDLGVSNGNLVAGLASNNSFLGNDDISWEQTGEANYGLDLGLFNSKVNVTLEYYNSNTIKLLLQQPAMQITGHQTSWNNIGSVNNKGLEIELTTTNFDSKNFTWKTTGNLSTNKNTLVNYGERTYQDNFGERSEVYRAIVGQPSIQYFGYKSAGVYTTFEEVAAAKALTDANGVPFTYAKFAPILGGLKTVDTNGDNKLDPNDRVVLGKPFPDFTYAMTNTFTFVNFDLSFMIQGVQGAKLIDGNLNYNENLRLNTAYTNNRYVSPMFPGDGKTVYSNTTSGSDLLLTDYAIQDGSYAALRELTFGYTVPKKIIKTFKISSFRAYFSAQNLIYLMAPGYKGVNPEARRTSGPYSNAFPLIDGYQRGVFPLNRTYTVGVDINF
ncbi:MAG: TonB-dependent receptor [Paludibacter sp.]|nr:TonB-dependent receptor [Paludibacter sp.]